MFNVSLLIFVQVYFDKLGTIKLNSDPLTHNFDWVDEVLKKSIIYSSECAAVKI